MSDELIGYMQMLLIIAGGVGGGLTVYWLIETLVGALRSRRKGMPRER